ncbi:MAG: helix-turn-helix domain containing protein [Acidaminococcaceae bacterium]|nr:helix-turn-helix domain containing protein [Acidaminococcaceae bacterium]
MAAAERVFSHKGYSQATLDEIIKIADTGKGTVYKWFSVKCWGDSLKCSLSEDCLYRQSSFSMPYTIFYFLKY